jgi:hypothetical protein
MTLCPIAVVAGCRKCPAYSVCPLKGVIGDHKPDADAAPPTKQTSAKGARADRDRTTRR